MNEESSEEEVEVHRKESKRTFISIRAMHMQQVINQPKQMENIFQTK